MGFTVNFGVRLNVGLMGIFGFMSMFWLFTMCWVSKGMPRDRRHRVLNAWTKWGDI